MHFAKLQIAELRFTKQNDRNIAQCPHLTIYTKYSSTQSTVHTVHKSTVNKNTKLEKLGVNFTKAHFQRYFLYHYISQD